MVKQCLARSRWGNLCLLYDGVDDVGDGGGGGVSVLVLV